MALPTLYTNLIEVAFDPEGAVLITAKLKTNGRPAEVARLALPLDVAAALGIALTQNIDLPNKEQDGSNDRETTTDL